jgi:hypothetical protein
MLSLRASSIVLAKRYRTLGGQRLTIKYFFPNESAYRGSLTTVGTPPAGVGTRADIEVIHARTFER